MGFSAPPVRWLIIIYFFQEFQSTDQNTSITLYDICTQAYCTVYSVQCTSCVHYTHTVYSTYVQCVQCICTVCTAHMYSAYSVYEWTCTNERVRRNSISMQIFRGINIRWASHCFPIEKAGRQDFTHMIARPSINKDIKNRKTTWGTRYMDLTY